MAIQAVRAILRKWGFDPDPQKAIVEELNKIVYGEVNVDPPNLAASAEATVVVALPAGTAPAGNEFVTVVPPSALEVGLCEINAWISGVDTLSVRVRNLSAGAIDGASRVWSYCVIRHSQIAASR